MAILTSDSDLGFRSEYDTEDKKVHFRKITSSRDLIILHIYISNNINKIYVKQKLIELKGEQDKSITISHNYI